MNLTSIIIDLIVIAIILLLVAINRKKGFINSISGLIVLVGTVVVTFLFAPIIVDFIYFNFVEAVVIGSITSFLTSNPALFDGVNLVSDFDKIFESLSDIGIPFINVTSSDVPAAVSYADPTEMATYLANSVFEDKIIAILNVVLFVVILVIMAIIITFLVKGISKVVNKIPVAGHLNRLLGGVVGLVKGFIVVYFVVQILSLVITYNADFIVSSSDVTQSYIVNFLSGFLIF